MTDQIIVRFTQQSTLEQLKSGASSLSSYNKSLASDKGEVSSAQGILNALSAAAGMPVTFVKATSRGEAVLKLDSAKPIKAIEFMARGMQRNAMIASVEADARRYPMAQNSPWGL